MTTLTSKIEALIAYANETTGKSDTKLGDAVKSLADGYGGGGDENFLRLMDGSLTGDIVIPESVTALRNSAFSNTNINSVDINGLETLSSQAFYNCRHLTSVNLGNVRDIGLQSFYRCPITTITLPNTLLSMSNYAF